MLAIGGIALAQKPGVSGKSTVNPENATDKGKASETVKLPSDLQTRENFARDETDAKALGPSAAEFKGLCWNGGCAGCNLGTERLNEAVRCSEGAYRIVGKPEGTLHAEPFSRDAPFTW